MDDVGSSAKVLQDFDLSLDLRTPDVSVHFSLSMQDKTLDAEMAHLLLLYWLQDLYDAFLVVDCVYALKDLTVLSSTHFAHHFIVVLVPASDQTSSYFEFDANNTEFVNELQMAPGNTPTEWRGFHSPSSLLA